VPRREWLPGLQGSEPGPPGGRESGVFVEKVMSSSRIRIPGRLAIALVCAGVVGLAAPATAAPVFDLGSKAAIQAVPEVKELRIEPGGAAVLSILLDLPGTHHLNSQPAPSFVVKEPPGLKVESVELRGDHHFDKFLEVDVYAGAVKILVHLAASASLRGAHTLSGELTYYPCSDADLTCFEKVDPVRVNLLAEPAVASAPTEDLAASGSLGEFVPEEESLAIASTTAGGVGAPSGGEASGAASEGFSPLGEGGTTLAERISDSFDKSLWLVYVLVFFGGVLASFTPCVYPMIPITVAVIGAGSAGSRRRGFVLSLIYVLGIAITYSVLGAAAASTGRAFGSFTQTFPVLMGIGLLLAILGASMFGFFEIQPPAFLTNLQSKRGPGQVGVLLMGAVTGLVASPCLGPVLIALLAWIAKTGDVFRGFSILFVFAMGMGLLLIAIGTFAGVLATLPKSGAWMVRVRELLGLVLAGAGVYYIGLALAGKGVPERATWMVAVGTALAVIGYMIRGAKGAGAGETQPAVSGMGPFLRKGAGTVVVVAGVYVALVGLSAGGLAPQWMSSGPAMTRSAGQDDLVWADSYESGMREARVENRPVMIDFFADWCVYCKKLESDVFTDDKVAAESRRFVNIRVDADRHKDIVREHEVLGLPTLVFLDSAGAESARIESYVKADQLLKRMRAVR
jgi:thiol:disulfide interchange protein DsbD